MEIQNKSTGRVYKIIAIKRKYVIIRWVNALHDIDKNIQITKSQLLNDFEEYSLGKNKEGYNEIVRNPLTNKIFDTVSTGRF